jgi:hypothetical protein
VVAEGNAHEGRGATAAAKGNAGGMADVSESTEWKLNVEKNKLKGLKVKEEVRMKNANRKLTLHDTPRMDWIEF